MITFAVAVFMLIATPGPGVLSTAGVGAAFGFRAGLRYVFGLFLGANLVALAVISGLAALILADPIIRTLLFAASTAYLFYLAMRIAFAGATVAFIAAQTQPGIVAGLMLQAINPKAYAVNTSFFSGFPIWENALTSEILWKFVVLNLIWIPIHLVWLWVGGAVKRMDLAPKIQRRINIAMAAAMLSVVVLAAFAALR